MNKPREQNATNTSENTTVHNPNIGPYKSGKVFIRPEFMPKPKPKTDENIKQSTPASASKESPVSGVDMVKGKKSCC